MPDAKPTFLSRCLAALNPVRSSNPADRRRATRFHGQAIRCTLGELVDISATGARIRCRRFYRPFEGRPVTIQIEQPGGIELITIRGDVCWTTHDDGRWYAGVAFNEMTEEAAEALGATLSSTSVSPLADAA